MRVRQLLLDVFSRHSSLVTRHCCWPACLPFGFASFDYAQDRQGLRARPRLEPIQHPINHHSGDGDVEPQRQRAASDAGVALEISFPGSSERHDDKRNDSGRERRVRDQDTEVNGADNTLSLKGFGTDLKVIREIRNQEETRGCEGRNHASLVCDDSPLSNEIIPSGEENRAERVEEGVKRWKEREGHSQKKWSVTSDE